MSRALRLTLPLVAALAGCAPAPAPAPSPPALLAVATPTFAAPAEFPLKGKPWPKVGFATMDGNPKQLADYAGKTVLLSLFAHWCPHCQVEIPRLELEVATRKPADFVFVPVECSAGSMDDVKAFIAEYKVTTPVFKDALHDVEVAFDLKSYPTLFLLGPDGTVRQTWTGELPPSLYDLFLTPVK